ncbi:MAG: hypothetical protein K5829_15345 [Treponema sp.]|nr:hypothetical protein [Treponema sp.]
MQKKSIISILLFFSLLLPLSSRSKYLDFGAALSSGYNFHTAEDLAKKQSLASDNSASRILLGANADITFKITEPLQFFAGADTFLDLNFKNSYYYNTFDYAFFAGIKVFPGNQTFDCSIAYALGNRSDFANIDDDKYTIKGSGMAKWGNGFKLSLEYTFLYKSDAKLCPFIGGSYRFMPRGNYNYDNILTAYVGIRF